MSHARRNLISQADIHENSLLKIDSELLSVLLRDHSTGMNLIWATDDYLQYGEKYTSGSEISVELISGSNDRIIKPRVYKNRFEQLSRSKDKAEVFTPSWVCNAQNNMIDNAWFGIERKRFNKEIENGWITTYYKVYFKQGEKSWRDYVTANRLEVTCGEAPYLVSRYDTVTGKYIRVKSRIGLLDRKLRVVTENTETREDWIQWAVKALKSVFGFDWQGDNVLLARENLLFTTIESYYEKFKENLTPDIIINFAEIISWNIWQMDGIKFVIPNSCHDVESDPDLTGYTVLKPCEGCKTGDHLRHSGIYCLIMDWNEGKPVRYVDLIQRRQNQ